MADRIAVPVCIMRGGTSKGVFINAKDLPKDKVKRDNYLLAIMGSPDPRQIDGLGGAHSLTSKVGIISKSECEGYDLEFLFAQLQPNSSLVDIEPNCGNMLAAVVPFAIETGVIEVERDITTLRVLTKNTGMISEITVETPNGKVNYEGVSKIDGVPGTSAPIYIKFLDTEGSICGSLFPTGNKRDSFTLSCGRNVEVTCIDNGMPMVLLQAQDFGVTGYESPEAYNKNEALKAEINRLRLVAAHKMGLGDVTDKNYPKMCLLAPAINGGTIHTRCYIPHVCHEAIGVLAAVTVGTATIYPDSIAYDIATEQVVDRVLSIEHPTGEFSVALDLATDCAELKVVGASLLRTARLIMKGEVYISPKKVNS
ncbi:4-oxalomesaconate tautomerase [Ignatzschineria indica]|uniref:4-oxalomesaconate tautomerase n=1 Tax=Ignatzschineria indica TaxID=472583 RepID=UPI002577EA39|nr:4-oxalomesaconate tautomerase [Ignatzschineria indica]MDM1544403.1 4-oxalomesaconate tautomerase [Ignatzschineria indica]